MEEVKHFREIIGEIFELGGTSNPMDYLPILEWVDYGGYKKKLMKLGRQTEAMLQCLIDERRNSKNRGLEDKSTTIDHLLSLQKSEPEYYTDEIIRGLILVSESCDAVFNIFHTTVICLFKYILFYLCFPHFPYFKSK